MSTIADSYYNNDPIYYFMYEQEGRHFRPNCGSFISCKVHIDFRDIQMREEKYILELTTFDGKHHTHQGRRKGLSWSRGHTAVERMGGCVGGSRTEVEDRSWKGWDPHSDPHSLVAKGERVTHSPRGSLCRGHPLTGQGTVTFNWL